METAWLIYKLYVAMLERNLSLLQRFWIRGGRLLSARHHFQSVVVSRQDMFRPCFFVLPVSSTIPLTLVGVAMCLEVSVSFTPLLVCAFLRLAGFKLRPCRVCSGIITLVATGVIVGKGPDDVLPMITYSRNPAGPS